MKRTLVILVLLGCGGGTKQRPVENQADPVVDAPVEEADPGDVAVVFQRTATGGVLELRGEQAAGADSDSDGTVNEVRVWRVHYRCL